MKTPGKKRTSLEAHRRHSIDGLPEDYFRIRDFEYVQPLYDLSFLLEVDALAKGMEIPKYRTFSLWRAGYSLDGYGTTIDRWLDGTAQDEDLDYVPSARIRDYLSRIRKLGTLSELRSYSGEQYSRCLRLRSFRGLGPSQIALSIPRRSLTDEWFNKAAINSSASRDRIKELFQSNNLGPWQVAHIIPPLLRLLHSIEIFYPVSLKWNLEGVQDALQPITVPVSVTANVQWETIASTALRALKKEKLFRRDSQQNEGELRLKHQMGWSFTIRSNASTTSISDIRQLAEAFDPLSSRLPITLQSDLHLHTAWSDGSASVNTMAEAIVASGLKFFAVTDHSRSSKLQGGLTPVLWIRQANALTLAAPVCPVLHGIEVDILKDGTLDLPKSLLIAADLVVASVHSSWTTEARTNTNRVLKAIESGCVDILAHPTSTIVGKPGVPDYLREPAEVYWDEIFEACSRWRVAVEMNCFPSRLDLPINLLRKAIGAGCAISFGSDAHARSHLLNLRYAEAALRQLEAPTVLNRLSYTNLQLWIKESRAGRKQAIKSKAHFVQPELLFEIAPSAQARTIEARIQPPQSLPHGSRVVGIDLTAGDKATGVAILDGFNVETCSLISDEEIIEFVRATQPKIVSIDSPLGLPGGGDVINKNAGIVRVAEHDLASIGIPAYPALIDSMEKLTMRGIRLRHAIEQLPLKPRVIESYPGAAQDILCIPRKQKSLGLLREGLRRLGLSGTGLQTLSHDEMDAITSAIVGRYFEANLFEPMGIPSEAQLIVPKVRPLMFSENPIICLAGKTGAGKSVVARYLAVFYGFQWVRTRDVIRELLLDDLSAPLSARIYKCELDAKAITEKDLREFGAVVLNDYKQLPLRRRLTSTVSAQDLPVVVDSIRDVVDLDQKMLGNRAVFTWFIDANDSVIRARLTERNKNGEPRATTETPVDRTTSLIRNQSDAILPNSSSLEELRWRVDDNLFASLALIK